MPVIPQIHEMFHRLFAGWTRIEPRCRSDDFAPGLEARTADPLWLLGRQWQFGEFAGEDAGSPIDVEVTHRSKLLQELIVGTADGDETRIDLALPLETLVEQESVETLVRLNEATQQDEATWDWRLRVRVGQQFERLCRRELDAAAAAVIQAYRSELGITVASGDDLVRTDRATQRFRRLMAGRAVDGWRLQEAREEDALPDTADLATVFASLDAWWGRLFSQPTADDPVAWRPERLDYEFGTATPVGADNEVVVTAPSYRNGDFDWHTCLATSDPDIEWKADADDPGPQHYPPTRVTFAGMPHPRWWAFDDARTDFGALDVATPDIAKLALMAFALIYADDWFIVPLGVPFGSLTQIDRLQVTDVFGQIVEIPRARTLGASALSRWEMYALARPEGDGGGAEFLLVPPAVGFREESEPIEEVRFLRDEGANMVWGVEHRVPNGLGYPVDGFDSQTERRAREREQAGVETGSAPAAPAAGLVYRLATPVPANWIPFIPADALSMLGDDFGPGIQSVRLLRAQMLLNETAAAPEPILAMSRLLDPDRSNPVLWLDEEAVSREGVKVQLTKQRVRWTNGETYVWLGKKVLVGRGEGRSGLRFDVVRTVTAESA